MKFARYLRDTQTPEWKRAYIDYRGLKKRIGEIRHAHEGLQDGTKYPNDLEAPSGANTSVPASPSSVVTRREFPTSAKSDDGYLKAPDRPTFNRMPSQGAVSKATGRTKKSLRGQPGHPFGEPLSLNELMPLLSPQEQAFFTDLDQELEKIESFYLDREKEMAARTHALGEQMNELSIQHKRLQDFRGNESPNWLTTFLTYLTKTPVSNETIHDEKRESMKRPAFDLEEYQHAKKKLKKAIIENYRGLETLNNYRILNITGIRKALKKFEKITKITCMQTYMSEKVDTSGVASGESVASMMKKMEESFASQFLSGDLKRAKTRLRVTTFHKSHHYSTFRSGMCLGLAVPAFAYGLYQSFLPATRASITGWDGLLFAYGMFLIPSLFAVLVGINLLVWAQCRINYVFIFELSTRTRLDYREYFEIPSLILAALCYAFCLSFMQIGSPHVAPYIWLLVWLGFTAMVMLNPIQGVMFTSARQWLLKKSGKLLVSGTRRVEFADFWLGDQYCSLIFTLSNLSFFVCSYAVEFEGSFQRCGSSSKFWPIGFCLAILPLLARAVQSVRRYADSGTHTHLINGGKYVSGIFSYLFYFIWRHEGGRGAIFALWIVFNTLYSAYALSWDLLMDWSILDLHAEHVLLRPSLLYSNAIPLYYFAIISNTIIRFIWLIYIPLSGPSLNVRTFIAGLLEVLRRWQWNFYRLENEHLGNMDQYRITREVPLPYSFDTVHDEADDGDDGDD